MEHIVIIADDLTGACDTGIKFRNLGIGTTVFVSSFNPDSLLYAGDPVISINTNTRSMAKENANRMLCKILYGIRAKGNFFYYKKIDSLLRGNVTHELEAFFEMLAPEFALITPAFPENNRRVAEGMIYTGRKNKPSTPINALQLLSDNTIRKCASIPLQVVRTGWQAIVQQIQTLRAEGATLLLADACTEEDLRTIAQVIRYLGKSCLPVGSAGLARHLAKQLVNELPHERGFLTRPCKCGVPLIVVGTRHPRTVEQVQYLKHHAKLQTFLLPVCGITQENVRSRLDDLFSQMDAAVGAACQGILLTSDHVYCGECDCNLVQRNEYNREILDALSISVEHLYRSRDISGMIITGGDMSGEVLSRLQLDRIHLCEELLPGVVAGEAEGNTGERTQLVIKSGGFGREDTLVRMYDYIACDFSTF